MRGNFIITDDMFKNSNLSEGDITNIMIGQQLNNKNHNLGWFAKRKHPVYPSSTEYMWDDEFGKIISDKKYINYLLALQEDGWELAYEIKKENI